MEQAMAAAEDKGLTGKASMPVLAKAFTKFLRGKARANQEMEW